VTKLLIIESPGNLKKLRSILGPDWRVEASVGHVRDLPAVGGLHVGPAPDFEPHYEVKAERKDVMARLRKAAASADVYLGTDPDREGEAIAWHLAQCLQLRAPKRVRFGAITAKAVLAAVASPTALNTRLVGAQEARRVVDRLVGYTVSPALQRRTGHSLSAGRVQTPAVRLVVQRECEIRAFKSRTHFGLRLHGRSGEGEWWLDLVGDGEDKDAMLLDRSVADRLAVLESVAVHTCGDTTEEEVPPPPLVTSTLQQLAAVRLGLSAKAAMDLAQKLYEGGHITYHRTDDPNLGEDALAGITAAAAALGLKSLTTLRRYPAPIGSQAGHPAITPTRWDQPVVGDDAEQQALYRLIWQRAVGCQLEAATYAVRRVEALGSDLGERGVVFAGSRRVIMRIGWRALLDGDERDEDKEDSATAEGEANVVNHLPVCKSGDWLGVVRGQVLEKRTRASPRFSEASLIRRLEKEGVGRPSTYASIMESIKARGYVTVKGKRLHATELGDLLVETVEGLFGFADLKYTRGVEKLLDDVALGSQTYSDVVGLMWARLEDEIEAFTAAEPICMRCGAPLRRLVGISKKSGKPYDFWKCSNRESDCADTFNTKDGEPDFAGRKNTRQERVVRSRTAIRAERGAEDD
jgi:DNA topoisomerase I